MARAVAGTAPSATHSAVAAAPVTVPDDLVERARQGGPALERLIELIHPQIVRYCRTRVAPGQRAPVGADDIAQEVCLAVVSALPGYQPGRAPFMAFVHGIASHKIADVHRKSSRLPSVPVPEVPDAPGDDQGPEELVMRTETAKRIEALMRTLPRAQQEVLRLRVVVGMSAEQTADTLSMSAGAVRVAQHRALNRLRALLTGAGEQPVDVGGWREVTG